ncbi:kinase-like protein [Hanseniaspora valbyensis NRRL Y-1626]|uniref:Kinase-like protein n=1 Tax=Hanseniaspora valbyensis NRRL Y-1626 TaxID=766949 RepID=A0A1B7TJ44_9ASCO|nr:kinase-like protein [Hanseniaspora valbyensis NRRL Y-1626]
MDKSKQELNTPSVLMRVYSENETNNFNLKTGHRLYDDYKNRNINIQKQNDNINIKNNGNVVTNDDNNLMNSPKYGQRHFSVNETSNQSDKVKDYLWLNFEKKRENNSRNKIYHNKYIDNSLTPDKKVINGEDDEKYLDLYFKENLDSIMYDNECLIPLEALPRNKSNKNLKRKRTTSNANENLERENVPMMYDEYIPDMDFINNFQRMQDYYEVNPTFTDETGDETDNNDEAGSRSESNVINEIMEHSHVDPMKINTENDTEIINYCPEESEMNESFIDVTKLPLEFENLPYSQRKKILIDMCPNRDYQEILMEVKKPDNKLKRIRTKGSTPSSLDSLKLARSNKIGGSVSTVDSILKRFDSNPGLQNSLASSKGLKIMGYKLNKIIGQGAWGVIRECTNDSDESDIKAMKIVKYRDNLSVKLSVINEVSVWKCLRHKNILSLVDYMQGENAMFCLMNRIHGGTLYDYVVKKWYNNETEYPLKKRLEYVLNYSKQIVNALDYLHNDAKVIHGDLKLENCLMTTSGRVLLCDFGMARKLIPTDFCSNESKKKSTFKKYSSFTNIRKNVNTNFNKQENENENSIMKKMINDKSLIHDDIPLGIMSFDLNIGPAYQSTVLKLQEQKHLDDIPPLNHIGSLPYAAPELLNIKNKTTTKTDIWALGVLMYTMCVYELPFQHEFEPRLKMMIESGKYDHKKLCQLVMKTNPSLCFVVEGCLTKDKDKRWDIEKIKRNLAL